MNAETLARRLRTRSLGRALHVFETTASTNADAVELARAGAPSGTLVVAEQQRAGRGRLGRSWHSPPGCNLYFSMVLRSELDAGRVAPLTVLAGLVLAETLEVVAEVPARIKWPNDVWVEGLKVAGILCELVLESSGTVIVVGIGVNVNGSREALPEALQQTATTLEHARGGRPMDRAELLVRFLERLEPAVERFETDGLAPFLAEANRLSVLDGTAVRVQRGEHTLTGVARGILPDGALEIQPQSGEALAIGSGEVTLVRPVSGESCASSARAKGESAC